MLPLEHEEKLHFCIPKIARQSDSYFGWRLKPEILAQGD